ncbi:MAG: hypothetical protein WCD80_02280 [Desulfobaccales bacterium]
MAIIVGLFVTSLVGPFSRQAFKLVRASDNYFAKVIGLGLVIWLVPALAGSLSGSAFSYRGFSLTVGVMAGLLPALVGGPLSQPDKRPAREVQGYAQRA